MPYRLLIAWRYFFARHHRSVVNIISHISLGGIVVCSFSLIVVLSVYNGIGQLTQQLFSVFDPELRVESVEGKSFRCDASAINALMAIEGVASVTPWVEEKAWAVYRDQEAIIDLRGVGYEYGHLTGIDSMIAEGSWTIGRGSNGTVGQILLGSELYYRLGISRMSNMPIRLLIPHREGNLGITLDESFNSSLTYPTGYFLIQQDLDSRYALCDIEVVRHLLDYSDDECSVVAIGLKSGASKERVRGTVMEKMAEYNPSQSFLCKDRMEQQPLYYKIFRSERLAIYLILGLITLVASLTQVASTRLLVIEKRNVSKTLQAIGLNEQDVRRVYCLQGVIITATGCLFGLLLGGIVCLAQQQFGVVPMGENFVTPAFPVAMRGIDFLWVFLIVMGIGSVVVTLTVRQTAVFPSHP